MFFLPIILQIVEKMCTSWYSFNVDGLTYLLLLNAAWTGVLTSSLGGRGEAPTDGHGQITPSVLYRWQGSLVQVQVSLTVISAMFMSTKLSFNNNIFLSNKYYSPL